MPFSRKKSCTNCRKARGRCSRALPRCSQCAKRNLECIYDGKDVGLAGPWQHPHQISQTPVWPSAVSTSQLGENEFRWSDMHLHLESNSSLLDSGHNVLHMDRDALGSFGSGGSSSFWPLTTSSIVGIPAPISANAKEVSEDIFHATTPMAQRIGTLESEDGPNVGFLPGAEVEPTTVQDDWSEFGIHGFANQRVMRRRKILEGLLQGTIILGQILNYPKMIVDGLQLPPFIHPPCSVEEELSPDCGLHGKHQCLPPELAICASMVQLFNSRTSSSSSSVWRSIYIERERLHREFYNLALENKLAALQAVTIYLILQAEDIESAARNESGILLATVLEFIFHLKKAQNWKQEAFCGAPDRRSWIFRESLRRTVALLSIFELLLEGLVQPSHDSDKSARYYFQFVPLPCVRELWEARTNREWRVQYNRYFSRKETARTLTVEDLMFSIDSGTPGAPTGQNESTQLLADVAKWCGSADTLGWLVWMVIPLDKYYVDSSKGICN